MDNSNNNINNVRVKYNLRNRKDEDSVINQKLIMKLIILLIIKINFVVKIIIQKLIEIINGMMLMIKIWIKIIQVEMQTWIMVIWI